VVAVLAQTLATPPFVWAASPQQEPPPPKPAGEEVPTFGVGTAAVTLDVVVRDKKARAVRDLKASDFDVYEDGVKQTVESFNVFGSRTAPPETPEPSAPAPTAPAAAPAPVSAEPAEAPEAPQVIAFVFDRLTAGARDIAYKASLTYVEKGHVEGDLVGVF